MDTDFSVEDEKSNVPNINSISKTPIYSKELKDYTKLSTPINLPEAIEVPENKNLLQNIYSTLFMSQYLSPQENIKRE